ncbi:PqqD family protein [Tunturiibacter lichenicola]|jgi:hypothetical protein|uniref:PqqD family protein n=1 Tax=Tunturiibacter lichenicola TaxID=2051959 RepID=UPI0021B23CB5|nr:PqqD family protein [Edaphobacter lichenicola]
MQIERLQSDALVENRLPDGSRVILDPTNETVFALNATAGAAWDACSAPTTLSNVADDMRRSLNPAITDEIAEEALLQLQDKKLVNTSGSSATRRQFLASLSAVALPLVVALTISDQKAHAMVARSAAPKPAPPKPKPKPILPFL